MKKIILVVLAIGMLVGVGYGCAGFGKFSPPAQNVVDFVCNPTPAEQADAAKWLAAFNSIQSGVAVFYPPLEIVQASTVMTVVKNGGCFVLSQVQAALDLLTAMQSKQVKMLGVKAAPRTAAEQFPALAARIKAGK